MPEPTIVYDPMAVAVKYGGGVVGYLPREESPVYFPILTALVGEGWMPQVTARLWGQGLGKVVDCPEWRVLG